MSKPIPLPATAQPTVLLTGFDPFGDDRDSPTPTNPSWLAVQRLHGASIAGLRVETVQLPTSFARAPYALRAAVRRHRPVLVLCVGQAGGRRALSLERVAINLMDARIADNDGAQPTDMPVTRGGPAAYFSTLPLKAMWSAVLAAGIPVEISQTAGTFVCFEVFYVLMRALARMPEPRARGGFVHVPFLPEQCIHLHGMPSMALDQVVAALRIALMTALNTRDDLHLVGGATH